LGSEIFKRGSRKETHHIPALNPSCNRVCCYPYLPFTVVEYYAFLVKTAVSSLGQLVFFESMLLYFISPPSQVFAGREFVSKSVISSVADPDPWIHVFLGLPDPHPDPLVRDTDSDPNPSIIKQK
jgi:hypothetical protein